MNKNKIRFYGFLLLACAQLYVPIRLIYKKEVVLSEGKEFKFKTAPVDPSDPFRGKYITLEFEDTRVPSDTALDWSINETAYAIVYIATDGFARVRRVAKEKPGDGTFYFKANVDYIPDMDKNELVLRFPFDRLYMEESKASTAEHVYRQNFRDSTQVSYAAVLIKDGEAVLKDVYINDTSIREIAKEYNNRK